MGHYISGHCDDPEYLRYLISGVGHRRLQLDWLGGPFGPWSLSSPPGAEAWLDPDFKEIILDSSELMYAGTSCNICSAEVGSCEGHATCRSIIALGGIYLQLYLNCYALMQKKQENVFQETMLYYVKENGMKAVAQLIQLS